MNAIITYCLADELDEFHRSVREALSALQSIAEHAPNQKLWQFGKICRVLREAIVRLDDIYPGVYPNAAVQLGVDSRYYGITPV